MIHSRLSFFVPDDCLLLAESSRSESTKSHRPNVRFREKRTLLTGHYLECHYTDGCECRRIRGNTMADVEVGQIYEGRVAKLMDFGAFVTILPGKDGLVHISEISDERVERVSDKLNEGDTIRVKVLEVDRQGRIRLSMRNLDAV